MKKAVIQIQIQAHEYDEKKREYREPIPNDIMQAYGIPFKQIIYIDGQDENELLTKIKEWIKSGK